MDSGRSAATLVLLDSAKAEVGNIPVSQKIFTNCKRACLLKPTKIMDVSNASSLLNN